MNLGDLGTEPRKGKCIIPSTLEEGEESDCDEHAHKLSEKQLDVIRARTVVAVDVAAAIIEGRISTAFAEKILREPQTAVI